MTKTYNFKDDKEAEKYWENERIMKQNSEDWFYADDVKKQQLHFDNQRRAAENDAIDGGKRTFNENTGDWSFQQGNKQQESPLNKQYVSANQDEIDRLMNDIQGSEPFSYNPDADPSYKAYEDMYRREGDRASKSTLADIATAQGGVSSYAASAAQQASNAYAQGLTDKIPELEALAYQKYSTDRNDKYNQLNSLMTLDDIAYGRYNDQWNRDYMLDETTYNRATAAEDKKTENERWQLERADRNYLNDIEVARQARNDLIALIGTGYKPTDGDLKWADLTREDVERIKYMNMFGIYPEFAPTQFVTEKSNGSSREKGGSQKYEPTGKSSPTLNDLQIETSQYPLTAKDYQIEQIVKRVENGEISEEDGRKMIDEIRKGS